MFKQSPDGFFKSKTRWYYERKEDLISGFVNIFSLILPSFIIFLVFSFYTTQLFFDLTGIVVSRGKFALVYIFSLIVSGYLSRKYYPWFFSDLWFLIAWGSIFSFIFYYIMLNW